jgi:phosphonate transport system ATP-binding protein
MPSTRPAIRFEAVTHVYPPSRTALRSISLSIEPGERVALVGPSGAGKSTLLRAINGLLVPTQGSVEVLGRDVRSLNEAGRMELRRSVGMVFQEFALVDRLSVLANVLVGRLGYNRSVASLFRLFPAADIALAREALGKVGLTEYEEQQVRRLSGGQKQRVAIARALVQQPAIILGDEPTANLDIRTADEILALLVDLTQEQETAMVLSLHDVVAARRRCSRVIALRDGSVAWDGPAERFTDERVNDVFYAPA